MTFKLEDGQYLIKDKGRAIGSISRLGYHGDFFYRPSFPSTHGFADFLTVEQLMSISRQLDFLNSNKE